SQLGSAIQHASPPEERARHDIAIEEGTRLASILRCSELNVNSSHHQAIRNVGEGFRVTAHAPDGIAEGLEDPVHPFYLGVQWHPEDMAAESSAATLFGAFVEAARKYAESKREPAGEASPAGRMAAE
ncbi:MAG TPA: gamma-glutamyl-gamma-aminobutyrate hydrolase family protein, partial [Thermoanaerobaculia bacterium]|nr:gamma-glutamyl-gamma-aminobutyrate hydrolase family protein [Thermoanaerobaculia bacterium]